MTHPHGGPVAAVPDWAVLVLPFIAVAAYLLGALRMWSKDTPWPFGRFAAWTAGWSCVGTALVGPLATSVDFTSHVVSHLLLGMFGPLLLVLSAPVTVILRTLPVRVARVPARLLAARPSTALTNPWVAAALDVGGLWVLHRTHLVDPHHPVVRVHMVMAGVLFTFAVLGGPDPAPHRAGWSNRAAALVAASAAHGVLTKLLSADPPPGSDGTGGVVMYYGGGAVEVVLMILLCRSRLSPLTHHRLGSAVTAARVLGRA